MAGTTIQLAGGTEKIESCLEKVKHYCRPIGGGGIAAFELYDQVQVNEDDELTVCDIWVANGISAGIEHNHVVELWAVRRKIGQLLASIPKKTGLESDESSGCFASLGALFGKWILLKGWAAARVTKVLHKKRPLLIPPVDSRVMDLYSKLYEHEGKRFSPSKANDVIDVIQRIRNDIRQENNLLHLQAIQQILESKGIELSIVRIFDIILWTYLEEHKVTQ